MDLYTDMNAASLPMLQAELTESSTQTTSMGSPNVPVIPRLSESRHPGVYRPSKGMSVGVPHTKAAVVGSQSREGRTPQRSPTRYLSNTVPELHQARSPSSVKARGPTGRSCVPVHRSWSPTPTEDVAETLKGMSRGVRGPDVFPEIDWENASTAERRSTMLAVFKMVLCFLNDSARATKVEAAVRDVTEEDLVYFFTWICPDIRDDYQKVDRDALEVAVNRLLGEESIQE